MKVNIIIEEDIYWFLSIDIGIILDISINHISKYNNNECKLFLFNTNNELFLSYTGVSHLVDNNKHILCNKLLKWVKEIIYSKDEVISENIISDEELVINDIVPKDPSCLIKAFENTEISILIENDKILHYNENYLFL